MKPKASILVMIFIIISILTMLSSPVDAKFRAPNPIKFIKRLWAKFRRGKQQQDPPGWMTTKTDCPPLPFPLGPSQSTDASEIAKLTSEKDTLLKHIETLKSTTATARRDLSKILVEKNRASHGTGTDKNTTAGANSDGTPAPACDSAEAPRIPSYEALTFISIGLLMMTAAAISKARDEKIKGDKLTQKLKGTTLVTVVEKEVVSYRNRIKELETQGQREREAAEATAKELAALQGTVAGWEVHVRSIAATTVADRKEMNGLLATKQALEGRVAQLEQEVLQLELKLKLQEKSVSHGAPSANTSGTSGSGISGLVVVEEVTPVGRPSAAMAQAHPPAHGTGQASAHPTGKAPGQAPQTAAQGGGSGNDAELLAVKARLVELEGQLKTLPQLREEKDIALKELKRTSDLLDALDTTQSTQGGQLATQTEQLVGLKSERDQLVSSKGMLVLSLENSKREVGECLTRIAELEGLVADSRRFVLVEQERDELLAGKARTDQCFIDMEQQLTLEKRKVADHLAAIRDLEQRLSEAERRKGVKFALSPTPRTPTNGGSSPGGVDNGGDSLSTSPMTSPPRPGSGGGVGGVEGSYAGGGAGGVGEGSERDAYDGQAVLSERIAELVNQATKDQRHIQALQDERETLLGYKEACESQSQQGSGSGGTDRSQAQLTAIIKQRDLLVTSKTILEEHIAELKQEVKWCDHDRDRLQKKEKTLDAQVKTFETQVTTLQGQLATLQGTVDTLTERNGKLESAHATADSQMALLRKNIADLVAAKDLKERELERDRQFLKETRDRSALLEVAVGELGQRAVWMEQQRDALKVKAAHARFGARAGADSVGGGTVGSGIGSGIGSGTGAGDGGGGGSRAASAVGGGGLLNTPVDDFEDDDDAWQEVFQRGAEGEYDPDATGGGGGGNGGGDREDLQSLRGYLRRAQDAVRRERVAEESEECEVRAALPVGLIGRGGSGGSGGSGGGEGGDMRRNDDSQNSLGNMFSGDVLTALTSLLTPAPATAPGSTSANPMYTAAVAAAGTNRSHTSTPAPTTASGGASNKANSTGTFDDDQDSLLGILISKK